jgi:hypothetical protein
MLSTPNGSNHRRTRNQTSKVRILEQKIFIVTIFQNTQFVRRKCLGLSLLFVIEQIDVGGIVIPQLAVFPSNIAEFL